VISAFKKTYDPVCCLHLANIVKLAVRQIVVIFKRYVVVFALKRQEKGTQFVHTLNGSGLAVGQ